MRKTTGRICAAVLVSALALTLGAQDQRWMRLYEASQKERPAKITSVERIAVEREPGTPMIIHGRVVAADGVTAMPDVIVFAYQTGDDGLYDEGRTGWRLKGWAKTDAEGRFEFRTIRPGSYPSGGIPAHVHLTVEGRGAPRQWAEELRFADDPHLSRADRRRAENSDPFNSVRPVSVRNGVQHVEFHIRVKSRADF